MANYQGVRIPIPVKTILFRGIKEKFDVISFADVFEHIKPENVFGVVNRILRWHSHKGTRVYLNIPDYGFQRFMQKYSPEKLQIVDEAYKVEEVVRLFRSQGFVPVFMSMYGIGVEAPQYNEYVFLHIEAITDYYKRRLLDGKDKE